MIHVDQIITPVNDDTNGISFAFFMLENGLREYSPRELPLARDIFCVRMAAMRFDHDYVGSLPTLQSVNSP